MVRVDETWGHDLDARGSAHYTQIPKEILNFK